MRALQAQPAPPRISVAWRMAAAYAMVFVLVVGTYAAAIHHGRQQELRALRAEQQKIATELQQVKSIADDAQPVVVLENGGTHVIVDLKRETQSIYY